MGRIAQGDLVVQPGPIALFVGDVAELPDRNAVGEFHLGRSVFAAEGHRVKGELEEFTAEVMGIDLRTAGDQFGCALTGVEPVLADHVPGEIADGLERIVEFPILQHVHEEQFQVVWDIYPAFHHVSGLGLHLAPRVDPGAFHRGYHRGGFHQREWRLAAMKLQPVAR